MNLERLTAMANDIANFFHAESDRQLAIEGVSGHMKKFWEPRMRKQLVAYAQSGQAHELSDLARAGVMRLAELDAPKG
jgi:formate dehydrogenase subunit delta